MDSSPESGRTYVEKVGLVSLVVFLFFLCVCVLVFLYFRRKIVRRGRGEGLRSGSSPVEGV
jgi:O-antigen ligase